MHLWTDLPVVWTSKVRLFFSDSNIHKLWFASSTELIHNHVIIYIYIYAFSSDQLFKRCFSYSGIAYEKYQHFILIRPMDFL